jgi:hypothetical protein
MTLFQQLDYIVSMIEWQVNDELEGKVASGRGPTLKHHPGIRLEGLRKTTKNLNQDSRSSGRELKPGPPEYDAGVLTTWSWRSVVLNKVYVCGLDLCSWYVMKLQVL